MKYFAIKYNEEGEWDKDEKFLYKFNCLVFSEIVDTIYNSFGKLKDKETIMKVVIDSPDQLMVVRFDYNEKGISEFLDDANRYLEQDEKYELCSKILELKNKFIAKNLE